MAQFICEKQGRCCPYEFYDSIEQAISDSEDGIPCDHLVEVSPVRHAKWGVNVGMNFFKERNCPVCKKRIESNFWNYCPNCGAKMDGGIDNG